MRAGLHSAFTALAPPRPGEGRVGKHVRLALLRALHPLLVRRHHLLDLLVLLDGDAVRSPASEEARRVVDALRGRRMSCLPRALAGYAALRSGGADVRFVIGLRPDGGEVAGHAWLELDGAPLGEPEDPRTRWAIAFAHPPLPPTEQEPRMSSPVPRPDVILTELQDGTGVLLHLGTKFYFALNATGVAAWKLLSSGEATTPEEIARRLAESFSGTSAEEARHDVEALLAELRAEDLLPLGG
jgi:hypothetical protein